MFNEGKEIVKYLEENREQIRTLCYYPDDVLNCENLIKLMDYIFLLEAEVDSRTTLYNNAKELYLSTRNKTKQLEDNIDEAIEYIKHSWRLKFDQVYDTSKYLSGWEAEELLSILERGKE